MTAPAPDAYAEWRLQSAPAIWLDRAMEVLWLFAVLMVPLTVSNIPDNPLPVPIPIEVAKVALLRTIASLILICWTLRCVVESQSRTAAPGKRDSSLFQFPTRVIGWLVDQPSRWLVVGVGFFLFVVLSSALLSVSVQGSLWGLIPGEDYYDVYNIVCYLVVFGALVRFLKRKEQLERLLISIVAAGTAVGGYAILQHHGTDFLKIADPFPLRTPSTLGNPIFAASLLLITLTVSVALATRALQRPIQTSRQWALVCGWALILTLQISAMIFTLSRGPWVGTSISIVTFIFLIVAFLGFRPAGRSLLILALSLVTSVLIIMLPPSLGNYRGPSEDTTDLDEISGRFTSIRQEGLSQRFGIWEISIPIALERPWFPFDDLPLAFMRPLVGYGPNTFSSVFMLRSEPRGDDRLPWRAEHAHNYLIHQWVELGFLGLLASLILFVAPVVGGGYQLLKGDYTDENKILISGVLAAMVGRFVEQMVGVAKVSDLLLFWVLLAVVVVFPVVAVTSVREVTGRRTAVSAARQPRRRRERSRQAVPMLLDTGLAARIAAAVVVIVIVLVVGWFNVGSNIHALLTISDLNRAYFRGDLIESARILDDAISASPDVALYHKSRGIVYSNLLDSYGSIREPKCARITSVEGDYQTCLAQKAYDSYARQVELLPYLLTPRLDLAQAAAKLNFYKRDPSLATEALRLYSESANMAPYNWPLWNQVAKTQIELSQGHDALITLEKSFAITEDSKSSAEALLLRGLLRAEQGEPGLAIQDYSQSIALDPIHALAFNNRANLYSRQGEYARAIADYGEAIRLDSANPLPYSNRGDTYLLQGDYWRAVEDYNQVVFLDSGFVSAYANRAIAYARLGMHSEAQQDIERAVTLGMDRETLEQAVGAAEN